MSTFVKKSKWALMSALLFARVKVRCHCGAIIKVHPSKIVVDKKKTPIIADGAMGDYIAGYNESETETCICPCDKKEEVIVSEYSNGGYTTGPGGYSNIVD